MGLRSLKEKLAVVAWCRENPILVYGIVLFTIYALAGKL